MDFRKNLLPIQKKKTPKVIYFIHIPKTSGMSLKCVSKRIKFKSCGHNFNVANSYRTPANKGGWSGYKSPYWPICRYPIKNNLKISIVRNPFDLLTSYYFHGVKLKPNKKYCHSGWASCNYTHQFKSFGQFIKGYTDKKTKWHQPLFKQFLFSQLFNKNGECVPDIIIKYEYLNDAIPILNKFFGHEVLKRVKNHKSNRKTKNYKEYYTDELRELVSNKCKRELEAFGYTFDGSTNDCPFIFPKNLRYSIANDKMILN